VGLVQVATVSELRLLLEWQMSPDDIVDPVRSPGTKIEWYLTEYPGFSRYLDSLCLSDSWRIVGNGEAPNYH